MHSSSNPRGRKPARKCVQKWVCDYVYRDMRGRELFRKKRYEHVDCQCGRGKSFTYAWQRTPGGAYIHSKPPDADYYLYRLDALWSVRAACARMDVYWCEGEKDADRLAAGGRLGIPVDTTSHHQGAGNATAQQAKWLLSAGRVFLVADADEPGAYDAAVRYDLLVDAGFKGELSIVRAREGKDAADHCDAGYYADQLVPVDMQRLEEAARRYAAERKSNGDRYVA
jgi:hypothetical protein